MGGARNSFELAASSCSAPLSLSVAASSIPGVGVVLDVLGAAAETDLFFLFGSSFFLV